MFTRRHAALAPGVMIVGSAALSAAWVQNYPARLLKFVGPQAAGGTTDGLTIPPSLLARADEVIE